MILGNKTAAKPHLAGAHGFKVYDEGEPAPIATVVGIHVQPGSPPSVNSAAPGPQKYVIT